MHDYDTVYDQVADASQVIDNATAEYIFEEGAVPEPLRLRLNNIQTEIDRLARLARQQVEQHGDTFGPTDTYFDMPATLRIHWDRTEKCIVSAGISVDPNWSPSNVADEDGNEHGSDSNQCNAWRHFLTELNSSDIR